MSWGNKILAVFIVFASFIGVLVYKCMNQNFELVSADYYKDELRYQDKIDGSKNAATVAGVQVLQVGDKVVLTLPKEMEGLSVTGNVWFYCPAKSAADRHFAIQLDDKGQMSIPVTKFSKANYQVKVSWQTGNEKYYAERHVQLNYKYALANSHNGIFTRVAK